MSNRRVKRRLAFRALAIDVNPLPVFRDVRESIDAFLLQSHPIAGANFPADVFAQSAGRIQLNWRHEMSSMSIAQHQTARSCAKEDANMRGGSQDPNPISRSTKCFLMASVVWIRYFVSSIQREAARLRQKDRTRKDADA